MRAVLKGRQMFNCFKCVGSTLYFWFFFFFLRLLNVQISVLWLICTQTNFLCILNEFLQKSVIRDKSDLLQRNQKLELCLNIFLTNIYRYLLLLRLLINQSTLQRFIFLRY